MDRYLNKCSKKSCKKLVISIIVISLIIIFNLTSMNNFRNAAASSGSSSIVINADTLEILGGSNYNTRLPMASTTKVVTALLAIESGKLDETVVIPKSAVGVEGSSIYVKENEKWKLRDLVYGLMLRSGNDSAVAIATFIGGSVENFSKMMNDKAILLGLKNTNFVNPHGLHDDNHYTSAYDLAVLTAQAYKYTEFVDIVSAKSHTTDLICGCDNTYYKYTFFNKNKLLSMFTGANGVKTGYTKVAGRCLVSGAKYGNLQLVSVVINHSDMWNDSMALLSNAKSKYKEVTLLKANDTVGYMTFNNSINEFDELRVKEDIVLYMPNNFDMEKLCIRLVNTTGICAPIKADTEIGEIQIYYDKDLIFSTNIYTIENIHDIKGVISANMNIH